MLAEVFPSGSIFRIDHYLGKETVQNILAMRFANDDVRADLERQLRRPRADHHGRGRRHRRPRRLLRRHRRRPRRDPEPPAPADVAWSRWRSRSSFDAENLRIEKQKVLASVELPEPARPDHRPRRSTPRAGPAARRSPASSTRRASRSPPRPRRTPRSRSTSTPAAGPGCRSTCAPASGSAAGSPRSRSSSSGRRTSRSAASSTEELTQNALVIRVQPDEGVTLRFGSKVPGTAMEIRDVNMDFVVRRLVHRVLARRPTSG